MGDSTLVPNGASGQLPLPAAVVLGCIHIAGRATGRRRRRGLRLRRSAASWCRSAGKLTLQILNFALLPLTGLLLLELRTHERVVAGDRFVVLLAVTEEIQIRADGRPIRSGLKWLAARRFRLGRRLLHLRPARHLCER